MKTRVVVIAFAASFIFLGCNSLRDLNIQNPDYVIRDVRPHVAIAIPLSESSIDFDFAIEVRNPNAVGLKLDRIDFDVLINDSQVVNGVSDQRIEIPARGVGDVRVRTRVGYRQLRTLFTEVADVVRGDRARYEMRGKAHYRTPVGRLSFPFTVYSAGRRQ